ncbi:glycosyltransferase [Diaphorobacter sp. HDW4B]|uniref:glycosyltransferase n=1 Tax=Diaphorobacter sp. HDW4B TaxID=2714925 RepID=UPI00140DE5F0|nr:glycosyltransferase [Diaphorobacter sp. HDW4B]QIL72645.1 glycosyltransferase [Diaphorobacter sp. HDW4B]
MPRKRAIFTICSNNYVPMAQVLLASARRHHPEADIYLCLADECIGEPGFYPDGCEVVTADALGIPDFREFAFRYDIMEFNTAVKPFMFRRLLERGHSHVVYLDPDIEVFAPLEHVFQCLDDGASFVLTPHLTQPAERDAFPDDIGIMRAGIYNLGFLGVGACDESDRLLRWWSKRLLHECVNEPERGIFVDQKFMDLIPGFADGARILRETAYNVAYWNLHQRELGGDSGAWTVDGKPLRFFHFSGIDPRNLLRLSKYTEAFRGDEISAQLSQLMRDYAEQVLSNGYGRVPGATYAYARFASGVRIPDVVRRIFRESHFSWLGNDPFEAYEEYLQMPSLKSSVCASGYVTRLMAEMHARSSWLSIAFNLQTEQGVAGLIDWFVHHGRDWLGDRRLVEPAALRAAKASVQKNPQRSDRPARKHGPELTVIGYLQLALGVGEAGRQVLHSLRHAGLPVSGMPIRLNALSETVDSSLEDLFDETVIAPLQIFGVNADQLPAVIESLKEKLPQDGWRTVIPFWELEHFPATWLKAFDLMDEVWAPTRFVQSMLAHKLDQPVVHMPLQLTFDVPPSVPRARWGLPEGAFLFYFAFDFLSFVERKNPLALVRAFRIAFGDAALRMNARVVIKTLNAEKANARGRELYDELCANPDVVLVDATLSREETLQLMNCCDAVVSLHRSEGLGLLVAEAMQLGKPVIATDYSATTELVSYETGWPVDFKLVPVREGEYPFHEGQVWAEPDEVHAAWQMRQVFHQRAEAGRRANAARELLQLRHGADACAQWLRERLGHVVLESNELLEPTAC